MAGWERLRGSVDELIWPSTAICSSWDLLDWALLGGFPRSAHGWMMLPAWYDGLTRTTARPLPSPPGAQRWGKRRDRGTEIGDCEKQGRNRGELRCFFCRICTYDEKQGELCILLGAKQGVFMPVFLQKPPFAFAGGCWKVRPFPLFSPRRRSEPAIAF